MKAERYFFTIWIESDGRLLDYGISVGFNVYQYYIV